MPRPKALSCPVSFPRCPTCGHYFLVHRARRRRYCATACQPRRGPTPLHPPYTTGKGIVMLWDGRHYIPEHRAIMARTEGRNLRANELVFHYDEDDTNNDPANLYILTRQEVARGWRDARRRMAKAKRESALSDW